MSSLCFRLENWQRDISIKSIGAWFLPTSSVWWSGNQLFRTVCLMYGEAFSYLGFYWCTISLVVLEWAPLIGFHRIHHVIAHVSTEALNEKEKKRHMSSLPREGGWKGIQLRSAPWSLDVPHPGPWSFEIPVLSCQVLKMQSENTVQYVDSNISTHTRNMNKWRLLLSDQFKSHICLCIH